MIINSESNWKKKDNVIKNLNPKLIYKNPGRTVMESVSVAVPGAIAAASPTPSSSLCKQ